MTMRSVGKRLVEEVPYGTYLWKLDDGTYLVDEEYRHLSIFCMKGNVAAQRALADAARSYGFPNGHAEWRPGARKVSDEEYEEQEERQRSGLVADQYDFGAIQDQIRASRND